MRWFFGVMLVCLVGAAQADTQTDTIDVRLHDRYGASYSSTSIGSDLASIYNIDFDPVLVIVLATTSENARFQEQVEILRDLDPEETGIIYAVGTPGGLSARSYKVTPNRAAQLLGAERGFRVLVLDEVGRVQRDSETVLSADDLVGETGAAE